MRYFLFGDMHGRWNSLEALLKAADLMDSEGGPGTYNDDTVVISVGDLINATLMDANNDEEMLIRSSDWVDLWVAGNHDIVYDFPHLSFSGFTSVGPVRTKYNEWRRSGNIVPSVVIANTLITHAGVNKAFNFKTAQEAHDAIWDVWDNYYVYADPVPGGSRPMGGEPWQFKGKRYDWASLLDGISRDRGGRAEVAGILWDDWKQPKNTNFNQIMGHTPIKTAPVLHTYLGNGVFTLNIDSGAKKGLTPYGVWINEDGSLGDFVTVEVDDGQEDS